MAESRNELPDRGLDTGDARSLLPGRACGVAKGLPEDYRAQRAPAWGKWNSRWRLSLLGSPVCRDQAGRASDRPGSARQRDRPAAHRYRAGDWDAGQYGAEILGRAYGHA